ncbi:hypothetical protein SDC9_164825 [bioreactor metagenome]|uniref:Uncharacterized protein n=1 Tax=bioreactor metagenome TaxID=1076179 RepID=A0A645FUZ3_9ZZZZ
MLLTAEVRTGDNNAAFCEVLRNVFADAGKTVRADLFMVDAI